MTVEIIGRNKKSGGILEKLSIFKRHDNIKELVKLQLNYYLYRTAVTALQ